MVGSVTTQVPIKEQFSESDNQSLDPVLAKGAPSVFIEISPGFCRHYSNGFCKRRDACQFSHNQENCPNHGYNETCQDKVCPHRHPRTCKHFLNARCFFGKNCLFFHPPDADPVMVHSMMSELQIKVKEMTMELSSIKEKLMEKEKGKPPDPMEIMKVIRPEMKTMCKKVLEISKYDITNAAEEIRLDLKVLDNTMGVIKDNARDEIAVIQQDTKAIFSKLSQMDTDHPLKSDEIREALKDSKEDIARIVKDMKHDIARKCKNIDDLASVNIESIWSEINKSEKDIWHLAKGATLADSRMAILEANHG